MHTTTPNCVVEAFHILREVLQTSADILDAPSNVVTEAFQAPTNVAQTSHQASTPARPRFLGCAWPRNASENQCVREQHLRRPGERAGCTFSQAYEQVIRLRCSGANTPASSCSDCAFLLGQESSRWVLASPQCHQALSHLGLFALGGVSVFCLVLVNHRSLAHGHGQDAGDAAEPEMQRGTEFRIGLEGHQ